MAAPSPALAALAALYLAGSPLPSADPAGLSREHAAALKAAREVQAGCFASEDDALYRARAAAVAEDLGLGARSTEAGKTYAACVRRVAGGGSAPALEARALEILSRSPGESLERRRRAEARLKALASGLSSDPGDAGALPGASAEGSAAGSATGAEPGAASRRDAAALARELNAAQAARPGLVRPSGVRVPEPVEFHALASEEVAPEPGPLDRAASFAAKDAPVVAEDLRTIAAALAEADLPAADAINPGNLDAMRSFFAWLKGVRASDLPSIDYAVLEKGLVGRYALATLGKGDVTLNHFIRGEPAKARAAVLVHELYHYWDKKVAKNYYANVSYGHISGGTQHTHEYDAYLATALFWRMVREDGSSSPLARLLDRVPVEPDAVRKLVDEAVRK
jgi:hypothetical protein